MAPYSLFTYCEFPGQVREWIGERRGETIEERRGEGKRGEERRKKERRGKEKRGEESKEEQMRGMDRRGAEISTGTSASGQ